MAQIPLGKNLKVNVPLKVDIKAVGTYIGPREKVSLQMQELIKQEPSAERDAELKRLEARLRELTD